MNRKSGLRCIIPHCGKSRRQEGVRLFRFPPPDTILGQVWREKCNLTDEIGKELRICNIHFPEECIGKRNLKIDSIPSLFLTLPAASDDLDLLDTPPLKKRRLSSEIIQGVCSSCLTNIKNCDLYRKKYNAEHNKYLKLKEKYNKLKNEKRSSFIKRTGKARLRKTKKVVKQTVFYNYINNLNISDETKTLCKMITRTKRKEYNEKEKNLTQNIFYISQSAYKFLRNNLNINLPHESTLYRWAPVKILQPGFKNDAHMHIKEKIKDLDDRDKNVVLLFDEISIRKEWRYNNSHDLIDGMEDLGFKRRNAFGKQVCVFMVRGLFKNWKCVVNYFVSENGVRGDDLKVLLEENIKMLLNWNLKVRAVTCDQGTNNRKCFKSLGVSSNKPYVYIEDFKVICLFDFPHLLKSLRNLLLSSNIMTPDGEVSWGVINELWEIDQKGVTRMCPKLTAQHMNPNSFERMRVNLAAQVLSKTVPAAIRSVVETNKFVKTSNEIALATAKFIDKVDKIFDCMNAGSLKSNNPYKTAMKKENQVEKYIEFFFDYISKVTICNNRKTVYFLDGIKQTLNGVLLLANDIWQLDTNIFFLLPKRLTQDSLENVFAIIRQKGGNNRNSSTAELNILLAKIMSINLIQFSNKSNCEKDDDVMLNINFDDNYEHIATDSASVTNTSCLLEQHSRLPEIDYVDFAEETFLNFDNLESFEVELLSMRYFVGYVGFKVLSKLRCDACEKNVRKEDEVITCPSEIFIFAKNYCSTSDFGNLLAPSDTFFNVCKTHIRVFDEIFKKYPEQRNLKKSIVDKCLVVTPDWFNIHDACHVHKIQFLEFMLLVMLRKMCLWAVKKSDKKANARLNTLTS